MDKFHFIDPPKSARPMVRWWWPGLDVQAEELVREIAELDRAGIGGVELQPFNIGLPPGLQKADPRWAGRVHRFMQPYHYEMMTAVIEAARPRGMIVDITQNSAWPTGGTHITLEDSLQTLLMSTEVVRGPKTWQGRVPRLRPLRLYAFFHNVVNRVAKGMDMLEFIPEDKRLLAVVAGRVSGKPGQFSSWKAKESTLLDLDSMVDLTGRVDAMGRLAWDVPEGTWQLFAVYEGTAGAMALQDTRSAPGKRALVVSHFDAEAEQRHLEAFFGPAHAYFGGDFGQTFRAFFTDSFELISPMHWTSGFLDEFRRRRGYDITPYLPAMYVPLKDVGYYTYSNEVGLPNFDFSADAGARMRWDFQRTLSELFVEQLIQGMAAWAQARGLQSRVQGYGMLADPLAMLGYSDIPETEQLYGGGALNFLKLAGAAGTLYERPVVTAESLVWQGRPYMTTPLKWRVALDRLYEAGINQAIYHGYPYRHPAFPHPGYHPFASPHSGFIVFASDMSTRDPLLAGVAESLNAYAGRGQYLLQRSRTSTRVGLFYQLFDYPNGNYVKEELVAGVLDELDAPLPKGNPITGRLAEMIMPSGGDVTGDRKWIQESAALAGELVGHGHYPIYFNEDRLLRARVEGRAVLMGEARFEALILFRETSLTIEAAAKLAELAAAGIPVIFVGCSPDRNPAWHDHAARDQAVRDAVAAIAGPVYRGPEEVLAALAAAGVQAEVAYDAPQPHVGFIHKIDRENGTETFWLRNRRREEREVVVTLPGSGTPVRLDLWTGGMAALPHEVTERGVRLALRLAGYESAVVMLADAATAAGLSHAAPVVLQADLEPVVTVGGLAFSADQRLPNGTQRLIELELTELRDWRDVPELANLGDPGTYRATFTLGSVAAGRRYFLQLERVCDRADIILNGQALAPLFVPPWRREITGLLHEGENTLTITVTPTVRNQLVGYGDGGSKDHAQYKGGVRMPSGLIGAVQVCALRR